jgi:hypothetical protein
MSTMRLINPKQVEGGGTPTLVIGIPARLARDLLPQAQAGRVFVCELTDDGILFRPVPDEPVEVPDWLQS